MPSGYPSIEPTMLASGSPSVDPTMALSSFPTASIGEKSQSNNGISHSNLILASVLGSIGGLIILGLIIGAVVYLVSTVFRERDTVAVPQTDIPKEMHVLVPGSEAV
jgi:hypothetical protein